MAYAFFRKITIDHTLCGSSDSTNFPVLFFGTYSWLATIANGGHLHSSSGFDLVFAADSAGVTLYNYERVKWVATTGESEFWIQIPTLSHTTDTVFYILYSNSSVTTDQSNQHGTWDSNYKGVWHFPDGGTLSMVDSTSNVNNGTGINSPTATNGQINGAVSIVYSSSQYIDVGTSSSLDITGALSVEFWGHRNTGSAINDNRVISHFTDGPPSSGWEVLAQATGGTELYQLQQGNGTGSGGNAGSGYSLANGANSTINDVNVHMVFTFDGTNTTVVYQNGSTVRTLTNFSTTGSPGGHTYIGNNVGSPTKYWNGWLDEIRVSNTVRSADYVTQAYNNQNSPSTFYTVGAQFGGSSSFLLNRGMEGDMVPMLNGGFNG